MSFESGEKIPEKIDQAAIRLGEKIYTGKNHADAIIAMEEDDPDWDTSETNPEDGFVTNTGRYVDRDEAGRIAKKAGQLSELRQDLQLKAEESLDSHWVNEPKPKR
mgnify:CR=1 FL=1